ncbi:MAG TPA: S8 family serine peptidase, partial [Myxococcaceae bacterium]|nr:S8 family serine peptidase [Myxococcaceae bacterium]
MFGVRPLAIAAKTLAATWLLLGLACNGAGTSSTPAPVPAEGGNSPRPASHKVQVNAEKAAQLEKQGARILGDYGTYKLVAVENDALESLKTAPDVELRDEYNQLQLNAGVINTASQHGQSLRGMALPATGKQFHLVQFVGPIQPEWYRALEATGVQVVTYIPNNAYLVYGDASTLSAMQRLTTGSQAIQWDGPYLNDYKLDPSINTVETAAYAIQLIQDDAANRETLGQIRSLQSREGVVQEALGYVNVNAYLDRAALYQLAMRPDVVSIQPSPEVKKLDERQNIIMIGSLNGNAPSGPGYMAWLASKGFTQEQFTASGFGVDVSDSGVDNATPATPNHFGLYAGGNVMGTSRLVYARLEGTPNTGSTIQGCDGHGTINAHIIGGFSNSAAGVFGDGTGYSTGLGMAPFVKVGSSVVFDPGTFTSPNFENLQARAYRDGMRISSNSWGANSNAYSASSQRHDALVRDAQPAASAVPAPGNQEMVIVFAAGNSGASANTVGNPGTAKNIITAGASENVRAFGGADGCSIADVGADNANDIISFSSRGPTSDGRKKPDLVAPGTHIAGGVAQAAGQRADPPANAAGQALSCFNGEGVCGGVGSNFYPAGQQWYTSSSGTSHSTPAIAGAAALVRQYFINQGMNVPSAAMTKAYLMNSARYMTGTGANDNLWSNSQGMGSVDMGMAFDGTPRLLDDQTAPNLFTASGQTRTFSGSIADSGKPFRVTLAWTDAPGSTTGNAYNNNLDLTVTIGGNTYKGNVFTGRSSVTGGTADAANNVESVFLPAGQTGNFTITVTATNINSDGVPNVGGALDQDFALIAYNSCDNAPTTPTGTAATVTGDNQIEVAWTATDATSYNIYRATTAGGPYTRVASASASPYVDTTVSGGTTYYYVVRGVLCAESANSNEASATATGACTLPPSFAGLATAASAGQSTCGNTLTWANGSPACGGTLSYSVYRATTSGFTPAVANRIATGISGTSFLDNLNVSQGTTYYYVVRATEAGEAISEESNTVQRSASPTGAVTPGARYFDDFDGNRPPSASAYWIPSTISGTSGTVNLTSGCRFQSSNTSYRVMGPASTSCAGTYPVSTQTRLVLGGNGSTAGVNGFAIPASSTTPQLTFNLWYDIENSYDGVYLNYSTSSATGPWTRVGDAVSATQPYISAGGYDGTLNSNTSIRTWNGRTGGLGSNGSLKAVTVNLA